MMQRIYADHAATTAVSEHALEVYMQVSRNTYGNPSGLYQEGRLALEALNEYRSQLAGYLGADPSEVVFTSGGSESDTQALRIAAEFGKATGRNQIIVSAIEHHAVLHAAEALRQEGFCVTVLNVQTSGQVSPEELKAALSDKTAMVSVMTANNETGVIQPVDELCRLAHAYGALFHTDAVQAVGHLPINFHESGFDLLSLSGHKFQGPRGTGALIIRQEVPAASLIYGGGQEKRRRAGTENLPGIAAMTTALADAVHSMREDAKAMQNLRDYLQAELCKIPGTHVNGHAKRLPGHLSVSFEGIESESLLLLLDQEGIAASSGSACSSHAVEPSHVLLAMGVEPQLAHGTLRLTLGVENTREEMDVIIEVLTELVEELRLLAGGDL